MGSYIQRPAIVLLLGFAVLAAMGCGGDGRDDRASPAGLKIYKHSMGQAPTSIDPVQAANIYANYVVLNAYDTLYTYKYLARPYELKPNLATAMPEISADKLTYTIRIKPGVRYIDDPAFSGGTGREVVAGDFIYSLKRHFDPSMRPQGAWLWQGRIEGLDAWKADGSDYAKEISGLQAIDRYTIRIELTRPYPQLIHTLTQGYSAIVPREAVEKYGKEFAINPVGSGPFKVISYDTSRIVYERNPNYREEPIDLAFEGYVAEDHAQFGLEVIDGRAPPFLDRLEIHFIKESSARWSSFTKGDEIQYAGVPNEQVDIVLASKDPIALEPEYAERYHLSAGLETGFVYSAFNMDFPEFGDHPDPERAARNKALRCAVIKSVDWDARNESFYMGLAEIYPGIIVPVVPEFDPTLSRDSVTRDVEGAKRLLVENGWTAKNLPVLTYGTTAGITSRLFYEQFRAWLVEIGYPQEKVVLKQFATFGDISKAWKESKLPLISSGWGLDYPDAENTLQLFYGPNGSPGSNSSNYSNPEYDRLYDESSVMLPSPERTVLYRRMNRILIDDCIVMTGMSRVQVLLWHKDVIAFPDRGILGGYFLRYVDVAADDNGATYGEVN